MSLSAFWKADEWVFFSNYFTIYNWVLEINPELELGDMQLDLRVLWATLPKGFKEENRQLNVVQQCIIQLLSILSWSLVQF